MEAYTMTCHHCGRRRKWIGFKTGIGKTALQLAHMRKEHTECFFCGSTNVTSGLDSESAQGKFFAESAAHAALLVSSLAQERKAVMLEWLEEAERELPRLLRERGSWTGVYVDYHAPYVERLWRPWRTGRIYLHRIHACAPEEALFHPHPWPSAMRVVRGGYEMAVGYGVGMRTPPTVARLVLPPGSAYEMSHPDGWHAVRPTHETSLSIMVSGPPWSRETHKSETPLRPLTTSERNALFEEFEA